MRRILLIMTLVIAGEMIFGLPFHTARFFRPTMLDVFALSNTQLGDLFAVYGVFAMLSYFPGGALADRYSARFLLSASLLATALGGFAMVTLPGPALLAVIYGYWGVTTIFLFWGALIRATRDWGGSKAQGKAFGILEAGRGLVAATVAAGLVIVFAAMMPDNPHLASAAEQRAAMQMLILLYSLITLASALLTWFLVPVPEPVAAAISRPPFAGMGYVVRRPVVWGQAAVIVCAYCGYKGLDNYSLYAVQVLGMDEVAAAGFATWGAYLRPVGALLAGYLADRFAAAHTIAVLFTVMLMTYIALSVLDPGSIGMNVILLNLFTSFFAVYALRGVYFALLEETGTPKAVTGAVVGMVSLLGFTPDIFFAPIAGRLLDASPGLPGHQDYFLFLAAVSMLGILVIGYLLLINRRDILLRWPAQT
ncbi:MAG TPA: MFS transporter [Woeseiaceae bacterium]|nr:MFS transporter [Woeseiaceae bacterium]